MGDGAVWAHHTSRLRALSYVFAVRSDDEDLGRRAEAMLAGLREPVASLHRAEPSLHWYSLRTFPAATTEGAVDLWRDQELLASAQRPGDALGWVVWDVNRSAAESRGDCLLFHAGALEANGAGLLVPGPSGSGKSTLVAALARAGLGYLSDELVAVDLASGLLLPYPKPITVKAGSFGLLADLAPDTAWRSDAPEWQVPVGEGTALTVGRPCLPSLVVVPRYDADAKTALTMLSDTEVFFSLALNAVNLLPLGAAGMAALGALAARCTCVALTVSDLDEACDLLWSLLEDLGPVLPVAEVCGHAG